MHWFDQNRIPIIGLSKRPRQKVPLHDREAVECLTTLFLIPEPRTESGTTLARPLARADRSSALDHGLTQLKLLLGGRVPSR